ncbi:uncharacterized protein LOC111453599 isoform X1 [Cucurbita moschata]|uniref:methylmalonate-semialdehyde dehydrogenase (CoA acylating) n=1 Tax=Cucurbita moschata TaxID=3662 RepID=A0A6J1GG09_CUCMO|nr:uncharacterized protein LOC111453599 isoform X1 [Cucurbita moschata]XP_022950510.1 uncharacterized protein LOC111453599 isoform X1 [Cucurbita moschata]XP_022950511.1 uncharacterized protein LOC111453599 isoform X1 [Cucurbita moschata]
MGTQSPTGLVPHKKMLPPQPGRFDDREDLIKYVRDFGADQGYVVTIKKSRKDRRVILGCDRGGLYRNRRKIDESRRKRKASSRLINCPFEAIGKKEDDAWMLTIRNGDHNHEPLKDMSEHPYSRRFTEDEVRQIKLMTEAGIKPRQVLKALKQHNPDLQSTPRHLYNLKAKIRQGNLSEKNFKSWRPNISLHANSSHTVIGDTVKHTHQLKVPNLIGGEFLDSHNCPVVDVINPATQEVVSHVPLTTYEEFKAAVNAAKQAFPSWKNTPISTRQCVMFKFQELILRDMDKLVTNIVIEQGKTLKDAQNDIICGLEVVKHVCGLATMQMGEFVPNASDGMDSYCIRDPIGVCAGICSFNHPATVSLWMFPVAVTCGNTFVLKPCETYPGASMLLAALAVEAGLPDGVLNIVHGTHDIINYICDDEDIKAISFASSCSAGKNIYARAAATGKQVQSHFGGKSHAIIMPDANMEATLNALVDAGFGTSGQTCMAINIVVSVGSSILWKKKLVECAKALKVNVGTDPNADLGPVITKEVKDRFCRLVQSGIEDGARLLLDGRDIVVPGYENGNFVGPTILSDVTTDMECYKEEFLGPVLLCMQADNLEEAISIVNRNNFLKLLSLKKNRNGASIFTTSGIYARKFQSEVEVGMVGINVAVTVPLPSSFNDKAGLEFYTKLKRVAQQWKNSASIGVSMTASSPSERHLRSRTVPSTLVSTSDKDSPGGRHRSLPPLPSTSERDSPSDAVLLPDPRISQTDLANERATSSPPTPDRDLHGQGLSLISTLSSEGDISNQELSPAMLLTGDRELPGQAMSVSTSRSSERMYLSQKCHWSEPLRADSIPSSSERIKGQASRTTTPALVLAAEGFYVPTSHDSNCLITHGSDSTVPSRRIDSMCQSSERVYMLAASHLNDSMSQTLRRTDSPLFSSSDGKDHISLDSQTDAALQSDRMYLSSLSERDGNMASASSQQVESLTSTSERMYIPPLGYRNAGIPPKSEEWLCIPTPALSERMYSQGPIVSADEFQDQGASLTLPTSKKYEH